MSSTSTVALFVLGFITAVILATGLTGCDNGSPGYSELDLLPKEMVEEMKVAVTACNLSPEACKLALRGSAHAYQNPWDREALPPVLEPTANAAEVPTKPEAKK